MFTDGSRSVVSKHNSAGIVPLDLLFRLHVVLLLLSAPVRLTKCDCVIPAKRFIVAPTLLKRLRLQIVAGAEMVANGRAKNLLVPMETIEVQNELVQTEPTFFQGPVDDGGRRAEKKWRQRVVRNNKTSKTKGYG